ncbi:bifunctional 4-hydroxy-2-oxoglutarate aldolase/2-dehydro-3-deoxy-phosphogluconate aldolase [Pseudomaricurvus alkylphenolicus]|jgi:2-dehydro-3-deoxyphosphogluconate aldolase/(4S)-4-hydroxy-2-oxoglutarate aldolase|uniref:bifunctional 4-hydroxy-2-oxoglutarate aldolase/2-dehydro-3-deoxy-phosphogluconate aldolase n=1 Tax=Pseudomaricurvus alkylphenolicus TaxID=1306991 RepID=UPI001422CD54|nr:bifunctional 4-hydroxy-2-oxoglutarate aldolase/2-dehydro-3-deoxy-phosphogluconate aldolase [Pseudomaricurvus alkylphenolicus]NIB43042.1 bifunctional 4-hydroxy-2-oxoglutarate aldolase/2-dehydro-3-deoxy-phosphogluconate aldolase [Pseudomaricurvus alkylphenolicus]
MTVTIKEIMQTSPVVPVMVIENIADAVPLADALVKGGLKVLEITLRTEAGLAAISAIKEAVPDAIVGAGTVINPQNLKDAIDAGSEFIVTPGTTPTLVDAALESGVPLLPGINTPSEAMALLEKGITAMKFFPAEAAGGIPMLKSIAGPLPQITFCPTGGVNPGNAADYLALKNVACVGGSWMAPADLVTAGNWEEIEKRAAEAAALKG